MTDIILDQTRQKFIPRGPVANPDLIAKAGDAWDQQQLVASTKHTPKCQTSFLHILITSATHDFAQRDIIRQTWCSKQQLINSFLPHDRNSLMQCTFLIGQSTNTTTMQHINQEIKQFGDILLGGYSDTYRNLTLKVLTGLHWVTTNCISKYILKTDDDCFVNSNILLKVLLAQKHSTLPLYLGMLLDSLEHTVVIRDPDNKWHVAEEEYAPDYYPAYISGTGYLLSQASASRIYGLSKLFTPLPVEDAYIGVLAEYAGIPARQSFRFTLIRENWQVCNFLYLIVIHHISISMQQEFQKRVKNAYSICDHSDLTLKW